MRGVKGPAPAFGTGGPDGALPRWPVTQLPALESANGRAESSVRGVGFSPTRREYVGNIPISIKKFGQAEKTALFRGPPAAHTKPEPTGKASRWTEARPTP